MRIRHDLETAADLIERSRAMLLRLEWCTSDCPVCGSGPDGHVKGGELGDLISDLGAYIRAPEPELAR